MVGISLNNEVIGRCVRAFKALAGVQSGTRKKLVKEIQNVCSKCDGAYSALLKRLVPVKSAFGDATKLAAELHLLAADTQTRARFKPERLCSEIDQLLADFGSNLAAVGYSVNFFSVNEIRTTLKSMGNYDQALYHEYDGFMAQLDTLASAITSAPASDRARLVAYAKAEISALEANLKESIRQMRDAKNRVVKLM